MDAKLSVQAINYPHHLLVEHVEPTSMVNMKLLSYVSVLLNHRAVSCEYHCVLI